MLAVWLRRFDPLYRLTRERERRLAKGDLPAHLATLLGHALPNPQTPLDELKILSLDIETTGLDPAQDHILSVGSVSIRQGRIDLQEANHDFVHGPHVVKAATAVINQIVPEMLEGGKELDQVMKELLHRMEGQILLAHGATVEQRFIDHYLLQRYGLASIPLPWLDTLALERSRHQHKGADGSDFRLASVRKRQGLPPYHSHDALTDAVATAELLLSLSKDLFAGQQPTLAELYKLQGRS